MVKKALTLLTSVLIALHLLMPFNIYADTITNSNVLGINTVLLSKSQNVAVTNSWYYVYQHTITLDADYIGTITLDVNLTYYNPSGSSSSYGTSTISNKTYFVNGNTIVINQTVTTDNFANQGPIVSSSYLLKSSNVVKTSTITELQQIIDLLTDIYSSNDQVEGLLSNQLQQLELVVSNTSLANQYLDKISKMHEFDIPFETFTFAYYLLSNEYDIADIYSLNYYRFPIFKLNSGDSLYKVYGTPTGSQSSYDLIFITDGNISNDSTLNNYFTVNDGSLVYVTRLNRFYINSVTYTLIHIKFTSFTSTGAKEIFSSANRLIIPICAYRSDKNDFSTDFALQFELSNKLLDNLELIANGTTASQSAADSSQSANEQLQTDSNTLFNQEDNFKSDMNNAMQSVNTTFRLENMGTKFVSSAQWVRTQYESLTNNTPFASLITFSLITGLALILLGKVYK